MMTNKPEGFMMIERLPTSVGKCKCFCCELNKLQNEDSEKEIWNRAIEAVLKLPLDELVYLEIGKLKK